MAKRQTIEEFVEKANLKHNNKYLYEKSIYKNSRTKIKIRCIEHGYFEQTPSNHIEGHGCPSCAENLKLTTEVFILKSNKIHNNRYNYNLANIKNNLTKVKIICELHGDFEQTPASHLSGHGCPDCFGKKKYNIKEFIQKSIKIHGDKFIYDEVNYINYNKKVKIKCRLHGIFEQTPHSHLSGKGCLVCSGFKKLTTEEVILRCKKTHGDLYTYDDVEYVNNITKITINCKTHGDFTQIPSIHFTGSGCPNCKISKGELEIKNILENNKFKYKSQYWFPDLKYKKYLYFDFGLLNQDGNLICLIEYNGIQHYKYNRWFHKSKGAFEKSQNRDKLKQDYCINNNIPFYIIKYNENIKEKMNELFKYKFYF